LEDAEESEKQAGLESEAKHRELEWQKSQQVAFTASSSKWNHSQVTAADGVYRSIVEW
jgi:hypothetical protein